MVVEVNPLDEFALGAEKTSTTPKISVVLATYNRLDLLRRVLGFLSEQTMPADRFEVIVVDDGSDVPVPPEIDVHAYPFSLTILRQENAGPAAARHFGILRARGEILVLIDDDMQLPPAFLEAHLAHHEGAPPTVVVGRYISDPAIGDKPVFERYHGLKWDLISEYVRTGKLRIDGTFLATGNTSMRREDYLRVGGLDFSLPRAEDMALGLALEEAGGRGGYSESAGSVHLSDHTDAKKWMGRAYMHGKLETRIAKKHPKMAHADPWRFAFTLPIAGRLLCVPGVLAPPLGAAFSKLAFRAAEAADDLGLERAALRATGLVYGMEYFRGMRDEAGSLGAMASGCASFLCKAAGAPEPLPGIPRWLSRAAARLFG